MKSLTAAAIVLSVTTASGMASAQEAPARPHASRLQPGQSQPGRVQPCTARVVYSEELPFAPIDTWLVKATLEITPRSGTPYIMTLQNRMPWQGPPPRRGQAFRAWCDPARPNYLQLASGAVARSAF